MFIQQKLPLNKIVCIIYKLYIYNYNNFFILKKKKKINYLNNVFLKKKKNIYFLYFFILGRSSLKYVYAFEDTYEIIKRVKNYEAYCIGQSKMEFDYDTGICTYRKTYIYTDSSSP